MAEQRSFLERPLAVVALVGGVLGAVGTVVAIVTSLGAVAPDQPRDDLAQARVSACVSAHGLTEPSQTQQLDEGRWYFRACSWPAPAGAGADGFSEITVFTEAGPGTSEACLLYTSKLEIAPEVKLSMWNSALTKGRTAPMLERSAIQITYAAKIVATHCPTVVPLGVDGKPVTLGVTWDNPALAAYFDRYSSRRSADDIRATGNHPSQSTFAAVAYHYLRETEPEALSLIHISRSGLVSRTVLGPTSSSTGAAVAGMGGPSYRPRMRRIVAFRSV